ncbi:hypothetical protein C0Q70_19431 [Pomacea canaliculata]|uniref:Neurotransmitter-gated ion-channel ligand-binding domain-containing protein n=1 Tax=Pomacea canaliculata TaxID=400727 RepID=A0A2T7NJB3_POMCA|nr:hypothetical protein C0Q70_19431 [Pomacea canaliculata]
MMKDLRQHLLTNYSKHVRPVRDEQTVVVINFSAFLSHLLYLNIKEQVLSTAGSLDLVKPGFQNEGYIAVNSMKPLRDDNALVVVNNDGTVQWQPGFNANTDCMVDVYSRVVRALMFELRGALVRYPCSAGLFLQSTQPVGMGTCLQEGLGKVRQRAEEIGNALK